MPTRLRWSLFLLLLAVLLPAIHLYWRARIGIDTSLGFRALWSAAFLVFGIALLGTLARWRPEGNVNGWRAAALFAGAVLAAAEVWAVSRGAIRGFSLEVWMAALFGLALAMILPRWLPEPWMRYWLALERRGQHTDTARGAAG